MSGSSNSSAKNLPNNNDTLLERIKSILDRTNPSAWEMGGEVLSPMMRFEKPRQSWELVFATKISAGTLVVRCSLPLKSIFLGKGFQYQPAGRESFYVEVRAKNWHHTEITDPYKRQETSDRRCETLATGQLALQIFMYVKETYEAFHKEQIAEFTQEAEGIVDKAISLMQNDPERLGFWDEISTDSTAHCFYNELDNCRIEIHRVIERRQEKLFIKVQRDNLITTINDYSAARELLKLVVEYEQSNKLQALSQVLEEV
jgi:cell division protein FtsI/penicillin-binding protein 2